MVQLMLAPEPRAEPPRERVLGAAERPRFRQAGELLCSWCGEPWTPKRDSGIYCRDACRAEAHRATRRERMRRHEDARKRMGMLTAAENNRAQRTIAQWAALMCFGAGEFEPEATRILRERGELPESPCISSDVRAWCEARGIELEWEKPWTGSLFQCDWFAPTGRTRAAYHKGSSARHVKEWRLTYEGRRVLAEMNSSLRGG